MKPEFRPLSVSVISVLGVFLPGVVWTALLLLALDRLNLLRDAGTYLASFGLRPETQPWVFVGGYTTLSVVIGASLRPHAMRIVENIARPRTWRQGAEKYNFMFPYKYEYENESTPMYSVIPERVKAIIGCPLNDKSRYEPFNTCKRILRVVSPTLWEELEYAEAESRMAAGLFLASIAAVVLSLRGGSII